jgi:hypothetical protein
VLHFVPSRSTSDLVKSWDGSHVVKKAMNRILVIAAVVAIIGVAAVGSILLVSLASSSSSSSSSSSTPDCAGLLTILSAGPLIASSPSPLPARNDNAFGFNLTQSSAIQGSFNSSLPVSFYLLTANQYSQWAHLVEPTPDSAYQITKPVNYTVGIENITQYALNVTVTSGSYDGLFLNFNNVNGSIALTTDWTECPTQSP